MAASEFITLKDGPTVPAAPLVLLLDLEARGFTLCQDGDALLIHPYERLTVSDCASIKRWRWHLLMLLDYQPPAVA
jgi:hypothetical protein